MREHDHSNATASPDQTQPDRTQADAMPAMPAAASDPWAAHHASIAALRLASVHLVRASEAGRQPAGHLPDDDDGDLPEDMVAFRFALARRIATFLGRHALCGLPACRRARACSGDPPDCFRGEPAPSPDELARATAEIGRALKQRLGGGR
jgi:hypothetical protein